MIDSKQAGTFSHRDYTGIRILSGFDNHSCRSRHEIYMVQRSEAELIRLRSHESLQFHFLQEEDKLRLTTICHAFGEGDIALCGRLPLSKRADVLLGAMY